MTFSVESSEIKAFDSSESRDRQIISEVCEVNTQELVLGSEESRLQNNRSIVR